MTGPIQNAEPQSVDWEIGNKETKASERLSPYSTHSSSNPLSYPVLSYLYLYFPVFFKIRNWNKNKTKNKNQIQKWNI